MPRRLGRVATTAACFALLTGSTSALAAGNSASLAVAAAAATAQSPATQNARGLPAGTGFFPGAILPAGILVAAGILAVVLANQGNKGNGRGFSPN